MGKAIISNGSATIVEGEQRTSFAVNTQTLANRIRLKRNKLLADCDWTQLADCPLSTQKKEEYRAYRQALRDITEQEGFPLSACFPSLKMGV